MAKLDPNTLIGIIQGKLGDLVFVRAKDGTVHVRRRPVREAPFTASELGSQSRLARANDYVQKLKSNPDAYAAYKGLPPSSEGNGPVTWRKPTLPTRQPFKILTFRSTPANPDNPFGSKRLTISKSRGCTSPQPNWMRC